MRRIEWTEDAVANLDAIVDYISAFNPAAAQRLAERLIAVADSLAAFSERGRDVGDGRRAMMIVRPYVLRYRVDLSTLCVKHIPITFSIPRNFLM